MSKETFFSELEDKIVKYIEENKRLSKFTVLNNNEGLFVFFNGDVLICYVISNNTKTVFKDFHSFVKNRESGDFSLINVFYEHIKNSILGYYNSNISIEKWPDEYSWINSQIDKILNKIGVIVYDSNYQPDYFIRGIMEIPEIALTYYWEGDFVKAEYSILDYLNESPWYNSIHLNGVELFYKDELSCFEYIKNNFCD